MSTYARDSLGAAIDGPQSGDAATTKVTTKRSRGSLATSPRRIKERESDQAPEIPMEQREGLKVESQCTQAL
jgi:hypothetical protein